MNKTHLSGVPFSISSSDYFNCIKMTSIFMNKPNEKKIHTKIITIFNGSLISHEIHRLLEKHEKRFNSIKKNNRQMNIQNRINKKKTNI